MKPITLNRQAAEAIINALALKIDGKPSSSKPFSEVPYDGLSSYDNWGQSHNDSKNDTPRTKALLTAYVMFCGGRIPLRGIPLVQGYIRPDLWVAGALVKKGYWTVDTEAEEFVMTQQGWEFLAGALSDL